jgi:FkbM family methyltransferase
MNIVLSELPFGLLSELVNDPDASFTFSQEGEDRILLDMFGDRGGQPGFYVDVGAHHPRRFSNTYAFYLCNWRGINIDAAPGSMDRFRADRPRDINLELGMGEDEGEAEFFIFDEPALNTFDRERARMLITTTRYRIVEVQTVPIRRLDGILDRYLPEGQAIDFLNVDVEGLDLSVVRSNDWTRYRPRVVLLEDGNADLLTLAATPCCRFMTDVGYRPVARLPRTVIYVDSHQAQG